MSKDNATTRRIREQLAFNALAMLEAQDNHEKLRAARTKLWARGMKAGLSQREMAEIHGCTPETIYHAVRRAGLV